MKRTTTLKILRTFLGRPTWALMQRRRASYQPALLVRSLTSPRSLGEVNPSTKLPPTKSRLLGWSPVAPVSSFCHCKWSTQIRLMSHHLRPWTHGSAKTCDKTLVISKVSEKEKNTCTSPVVELGSRVRGPVLFDSDHDTCVTHSLREDRHRMTLEL